MSNYQQECTNLRDIFLKLRYIVKCRVALQLTVSIPRCISDIILLVVVKLISSIGLYATAISCCEIMLNV